MQRKSNFWGHFCAKYEKVGVILRSLPHICAIHCADLGLKWVPPVANLSFEVRGGVGGAAALGAGGRGGRDDLPHRRDGEEEAEGEGYVGESVNELALIIDEWVPLHADSFKCIPKFKSTYHMALN